MKLHLAFESYRTHQYVLSNDFEGKVVTTLIEAKENKEENENSILYVHGFSDYFFQKHMLDFFVENQTNFFAVDLRKYGRSLLAHQHPNYCRSMEEYFEDLDTTIGEIKKRCPEGNIYLLGHSTGGLLVTYYAHKGNCKNEIKGLILNSPFFDFNVSKWLKPMIPFMAKIGQRIHPYLAVKAGVTPIYGQTLLKSYGGEWEYDTSKKPVYAFPAYFAWMAAIVEVQSFVKRAAPLNLPVLLIHSDRSSKPRVVNELSKRSDVVLNVDDIQRIGMKVSDKVTNCVIEGGIHDLFLSAKPVRELALEETLRFIQAKKAVG